MRLALVFGLLLPLATAAESPFFGASCPSPHAASLTSEFLSAAEAGAEPSLFGRSIEQPEKETYRVSLFHSFGGVQIIRVEVDSVSGSGQLYQSAFTHGAGAVPGDSLPVSAERIVRLRSAFKQASFWSLAPAYECRGCRDGAVWLVEAASSGKYGCVEWVNPRQAEFREIGKLMFEFAGKAGWEKAY